MAERDLPHIVVSDTAYPEQYQRRKQSIKSKPFPPRDRRAHGERLRSSLNDAASAGRSRRDAISVRVEGAKLGFYFQFDSFADSDVPLKLESLESSRNGIEVVSVRRVGAIQRAVVFVPDGKLQFFLKRFEEYLEEDTKTGKPKHKTLVESIAEIKLATIRELWTDTDEAYPEANQDIWWEVWLRRTDGAELERVEAFAEQSGSRLRGESLIFPHRIVVLMFGTAEALSASIDVLDDIAELRLAKDPPGDFLGMTGIEQADFVQDLASRLELPGTSAPSVCILDTGVNRGHPLLANSLASTDCSTYDPAWGSDDRRGHGTEMAGLALLGDLLPLLNSSDPVLLRHTLESVKILPNTGANDPNLYGHVTTEAASRAEVKSAAPQ